MYFKAPVLSLAKIIELVIDLKLSSFNLFDLRSSFSFLPMVNGVLPSPSVFGSCHGTS
jgi:hypothetical protein